MYVLYRQQLNTYICSSFVQSVFITFCFLLLTVSCRRQLASLLMLVSMVTCLRPRVSLLHSHWRGCSPANQLTGERYQTLLSRCGCYGAVIGQVSNYSCSPSLPEQAGVRNDSHPINSCNYVRLPLDDPVS